MGRGSALRRGLAWHRRKFSLQLTSILLVISILPLVLSYLAFYRTTEQTILGIARQQSLQTLRNQRDYLLLQLEQVESLAANLAQMDEITSALVKLNRETTDASFDTLALKARIGHLLGHYRNLNGLVSIDIFARNGNRYHVGETLPQPGEREDLVDSLWRQTLQSRTLVTWHGAQDSVHTHSNSSKVLPATSLLVDKDSSWQHPEPVAMLLISYSAQRLHDHFSRTVSATSEGGGFMLVLDEQHRLIYHPDPRNIGRQAEKDFAALLDGPSGSFIQRLGGQDVLLSYERIPDRNWYIASFIPKDTVLASMSGVRRVGGLMLAVIAALIVWLLSLFAIRITEPIEDIAEGFRNFQLNRIARGWRMPLPRTLESIENLAKWFNIFLESMEKRHESDTRLRIAATAFESQEGMYVSDANAVILQVNGALASITGYAASEVMGRSAALFNADDDGDGFVDEVRRAVRETGAWRGEIWSRRRNGQRYPAWLAVTGVRDEQDTVTHFVWMLTDITDRKANEEEIRQLAFYDSLTGLPNRRLLIDRLQQAVLDGPRRGRAVALMLLDLDKFKTLNDTLGHDVGDSLLKQVARRLLACVREGDTVARLGGDEFVVLVEGLDLSAGKAAAQVEALGLTILRSLNERFQDLGGLDYHCTSSIGVTLFSESHCRIEDLMKQADIALYQAKEAGRNTLRFFDPQMQARVIARARLEQSMRQGLSRREFEVHFQPRVGVDRRPVGAEVLVRWRHPELGTLLPASFIELAEETGLVVQLGQMVLRQGCEQLVAWTDDPGLRHLGLSVNVSPREFRQPDFVARVLGLVDGLGVDASKLTLEITENLFVDNVKEIVEKMTLLSRRGISFSLDDFGTGYSSLAYLKRMPLRELKIDRSFVDDVLTDANDATIARAVIALGQELGLEVVAEGVENDRQLAFLIESGCRSFQGNLFGAAMPLEGFERLAGRVDVPREEPSPAMT